MFRFVPVSRMLPGGISEKREPTASDTILANFAIGTIFKQHGTQYTLLDIQWVTQQIVAGVNFTLNLRVKNNEGVEELLRVIVWEQAWLNKKTLSSYKIVDAEE